MPSSVLSGALTTQSKRDPPAAPRTTTARPTAVTALPVLLSTPVSCRHSHRWSYRHRHRCRRYCSRPRRPCESHRPALRADVVFLELSAVTTGYCVGIVVAIIQGVCPRRFRHGTPATTCSRGMACTGDNHHGDPAMERGTTMRGRSMCIQSCCRCSLTCISTGRHEAVLAAFYIHGAAKIPWGGNAHGAVGKILPSAE